MAVDVTKSNFSEVLPVVKEALERCAFFAVDCEMTGLHTDTAKHEWYDDHHARCGGLRVCARNSPAWPQSHIEVG